MTVYGVFYWRYTRFDDYPMEFFQTLCKDEEIAKVYCKKLAEEYQKIKLTEEYQKNFVEETEYDDVEIKFSEYVFSDGFLDFENASDNDERAYGYGLYEPEYDICQEAVIYKLLEVATFLPTESR